MTDVLQEIGRAAVEIAGGAMHQLLLYAEAEEGVVSVGIFFRRTHDDVVHYRYPTSELTELLFAFWEDGHELIAPRSWGSVEYLIADGRFTTHLVAPELIDPDEARYKRRPRLLAKYFPGVEVDYSDPEG